MAAGVQRVDPATHYFMLQIDMELAVPNRRSSMRGVRARLEVHEIAQRGEVNSEDPAESWNAKFRMHRTSGKMPIDDEGLVEVVVYINMVQRQPDGGMVTAQRFMASVAYTKAVDPHHGKLTREHMLVLGDELGRATYWQVAQDLLSDIVTEYSPSSSAQHRYI